MNKYKVYRILFIVFRSVELAGVLTFFVLFAVYFLNGKNLTIITAACAVLLFVLIIELVYSLYKVTKRGIRSDCIKGNRRRK